jgi:hypothetical protein
MQSILISPTLAARLSINGFATVAYRVADAMLRRRVAPPALPEDAPASPDWLREVVSP